MKRNLGEILVFQDFGKSPHRPWNLASDRTGWQPSESLFADYIHSCVCFWCRVSIRLAAVRLSWPNPVRWGCKSVYLDCSMVGGLGIILFCIIFFCCGQSAVFFAHLVKRNISTFFFGLPVWVNWGTWHWGYPSDHKHILVPSATCLKMLLTSSSWRAKKFKLFHWLTKNECTTEVKIHSHHYCYSSQKCHWRECHGYWPVKCAHGLCYKTAFSARTKLCLITRQQRDWLPDTCNYWQGPRFIMWCKE